MYGHLCGFGSVYIGREEQSGLDPWPRCEGIVIKVPTGSDTTTGVGEQRRLSCLRAASGVMRLDVR
jgi:hypothetical protein